MRFSSPAVHTPLAYLHYTGSRDELREFLSQAGISTILQWGGYTLHQYHELNLNNDLKYTEEMTKKFMLLPLHAMLSDEDVVYICKKINEFYNSKNN